jgi:tight adherence protein B
MSRLLATAAICAAAALALASAALGAGGELEIVEGGAVFPDRAYVLTLPKKQSLSSFDVEVLENGEQVPNISVVSAGTARARTFAVVLAIDASNSMRGDAIDGAMAAARTFAAHRYRSQQLAIIAFNDRVRVLVPLSADSAEIQRKLAAPPDLDEGTRLYDAVALGVSMLRRANIVSGSIVVLSDGDDVGSSATAERAVEAAGRQHVRVFNVGLRGSGFDPGALESLAARTGGTYSEATTPDELTPILDALAEQFANRYLVSYRSLAGPNERVNVAVRVAGIRGDAASGYRTPALRLDVPPAYHRSLLDRALQSPALMVLVAVWISIVVSAAVIAILRPRGEPLVLRMAAFVSIAQDDQKEEKTTDRSPVLTSRLAESASPVTRTRWWSRFKRDLRIADIELSPRLIALWTLAVTALLLWLLPLVTGTPLSALFALGVPISVRAFLRRKLLRKRRQFAEQLPDNLEVLASALRAGHSLVGALSAVVDDASEPSKSEFSRVVADEQLGVALEDALARVVERMDNRDLDQVALVARLQRETGGNSAEVLDRVTENIRSREELRRLVQSLTAQGRLSRWVLTAIPVGLLAFLSIINFEYVRPLFTNPAGRFMLVTAAIMVTVGSLLIKKIVDIKV